MDALRKLTLLYGLVSLDKFTFSSTAAFKGNRPIYSLWDSEGYEIPSGFYEVLMNSNGETFRSADGNLQITIPTKGEKSVHDFQSLYDDGCSQFYLFFTAQELRDAGYNPTRSPGFNYWNPEAIRWEIRGHVVESFWAEHRFYVVPDGFFPVCYQLNDRDNTYQPSNPKFPVFTEDDMTSAWCFQPFFEDSRNNRSDAFFFIEFSIEELIDFGVEVPENLTGFKFDHVSAQFEEVQKPDGENGWDYVFREWAAPFCASEDCSCNHGNLAFDWEEKSYLVLEKHPVCSYLARTVDEGHTASQKSNPIMGLFSSQGGQYCDCNCYCSNCKKFYAPSHASMHQRHDDYSGWKCDN
jgi:hypothetical protein